MTRVPTMGPKTALARRLRDEGLTLSQIAERMQIGGALHRRTSRVANFLAMAKRHAEGTKFASGRPSAGTVVPMAASRPGDERNDHTPGCVTCGLRGSHACLPEAASELLHGGHGPGRTYPGSVAA